MVAAAGAAVSEALQEPRRRGLAPPVPWMKGRLARVRPRLMRGRAVDWRVHVVCRVLREMATRICHPLCYNLISSLRGPPRCSMP